ncbi:glycosyltransferase family 2 protein [Georgenia muralis]|uniref:glycosyltransferase family 2 protein n=1 Tax=Georgenia muralis TaxID=154117 RepID=UPI001B87D837|nr:glycosyltransferase [Georgenia muralis]
MVPAHDEERSIARLLDQLAPGAGDELLDVVVVCNGCTDATAAVARGYDVTVEEIPQASKRAALERGDAVARTYPRVYLDADVEITAGDVLRLVAAVATGRYLAAGPRRVVPRDGVTTAVRWYYDVWESLPQVRTGLFGRGVVVVSQAGAERIHRLPMLMSDDLVMSEAFAPHERVVVPEATVVVHPPRSVPDLLRRRVRVATGNAQSDAAGRRSDSARTSVRSVAGVVIRRPGLALKLPVFAAVTLAAHVGARRAVRHGDFTTWRRDESSRR